MRLPAPALCVHFKPVFQEGIRQEIRRCFNKFVDVASGCPCTGVIRVLTAEEFNGHMMMADSIRTVRCTSLLVCLFVCLVVCLIVCLVLRL
jgi:hypothetical protein